MKPIIKKRIRNLAIALSCSVIIGTGLYLPNEIIHADNSSKQQTIELCETFNVVDGYRANTKERLQHNNDEPIYIRISNELSEEQKSEIISALDQIFGIVYDINDNYKYEIIDSSSKINLLGKSIIDFGVALEETIRGNTFNAYTHDKNSFFSFGSKGVFNQKGVINYNKEYLQNEHKSGRFYYTTLHELLHLFGIDDIYGNENTYINTYINITGETTEWSKMITPNDYKLLVSMYAKDMSNMDELEKQEYINELNKKIDEYSIEYYNNYKQSHKQYLIENGYSEDDIKIAISQGEIDKNIDITFDGLHNVNVDEIYKIRVKVKGDKYVIATYDENDKVLEHCTGKAYHLGDQVFLQEVNFENFHNGEQTFTDLYLSINMYLDEQHPVYKLRNIINDVDDYSHRGLDTEYFNERNQGLTR